MIGIEITKQKNKSCAHFVKRPVYLELQYY